MDCIFLIFFISGGSMNNHLQIKTDRKNDVYDHLYTKKITKQLGELKNLTNTVKILHLNKTITNVAIDAKSDNSAAIALQNFVIFEHPMDKLDKGKFIKFNINHYD